ncbi:MAG: D-inositol-3-phosphate glycosyltransferase [Candidatus Sumerlaeota bacterium]|nr:D-inositol-3-phosphate glycosyltransferase [Candidatus Sumerlaeota bacterium]
MAPRFLFIVSGYPPLRTGGMELSCQRLATALARRGVGVVVLTLAAPDLPEDRIEAGVRVLRVITPWQVGPLWGVKYSLDVGMWMKRLEAEWDLALCFQLYLHSSVAVSIAGTLRKKIATRLANSGSGGDIEKMLAMRLGKKAVHHALRADALFPLSNDGARELHGWKVAPERLWRMPVFIDTVRFSPASSTPSPVFHYHGRFEKSKNLTGLIEAFALVHAAHPEARLQLVGDGGERAAIEEAARVSGAGESIAILPWTPHVEKHLGNVLCAVSASHSEGLSNALVEAMACGVPAIATDVSGTRDLLDPAGELGTADAVRGHGFMRARHGLIAPPGDVKAMAAAMRAMLEDAQLRPSLADGLDEHARERFSEGAAVSAFLNAAEAILAGRPSTPHERGFALDLFDGAEA